MTDLKAVLSRAQKAHGSSALIEADLLAPYSRASSPKDSPYAFFLMNFSSIRISTMPLSIMKQQEAYIEEE